MSLVLQSSSGGQITIQEPATASNFTATLPATTGTFVTTGTPQSGGVIQTVNFTTTSTTTTTSATFVTTNLTASITPRFSTSKILVLMSATIDSTDGANRQAVITLYRNATNLNAGGFTNAFTPAGRVMTPASIIYLDSPATTSSTAYTIYLASPNASGIVVFNQGSAIGSEVASITLMEIAA
jgi:hypothetical protein